MLRQGMKSWVLRKKKKKKEDEDFLESNPKAMDSPEASFDQGNHTVFLTQQELDDLNQVIGSSMDERIKVLREESDEVAVGALNHASDQPIESDKHKESQPAPRDKDSFDDENERSSALRGSKYWIECMEEAKNIRSSGSSDSADSYKPTISKERDAMPEPGTLQELSSNASLSAGPKTILLNSPRRSRFVLGKNPFDDDYEESLLTLASQSQQAGKQSIGKASSPRVPNFAEPAPKNPSLLSIDKETTIHARTAGEDVSDPLRSQQGVANQLLEHETSDRISMSPGHPVDQNESALSDDNGSVQSDGNGNTKHDEHEDSDGRSSDGERDGGEFEEDPYEWAYNVWIKKGLMKKRKQRRLRIITKPQDLSSPTNSPWKSFVSPRYDDFFAVDRARRRTRKSLPTNIAKQKYGHGNEHFHSILNQWRFKSETTSKVHRRSPEHLSLVSYKRNSFANLGDHPLFSPDKGYASRPTFSEHEDSPYDEHELISDAAVQGELEHPPFEETRNRLFDDGDGWSERDILPQISSESGIDSVQDTEPQVKAPESQASKLTGYILAHEYLTRSPSPSIIQGLSNESNPSTQFRWKSPPKSRCNFKSAVRLALETVEQGDFSAPRELEAKVDHFVSRESVGRRTVANTFNVDSKLAASLLESADGSSNTRSVSAPRPPRESNTMGFSLSARSFEGDHGSRTCETDSASSQPFMINQVWLDAAGSGSELSAPSSQAESLDEYGVEKHQAQACVRDIILPGGRCKRTSAPLSAESDTVSVVAETTSTIGRSMCTPRERLVHGEPLLVSDSPWMFTVVESGNKGHGDGRRSGRQSLSDRSCQNDDVVQLTKTSETQGSKRKGVCQCSKSLFSGTDEMIDFFLPIMGMACSCGKRSTQLKYAAEPTSLENILRPWQVEFLAAFGIYRGDQLVKAHHRSASALARAMRQYRRKQGMTPFQTKSCGMALKIWSRTCKSYVRSIRQQLISGTKELQLPDTLYIVSSYLEELPSRAKSVQRESLTPDEMDDDRQDVNFETNFDGHTGGGLEQDEYPDEILDVSNTDEHVADMRTNL